MKGASLFAAVAVVLVANLFALLHAFSNRSGAVEADIILTQRELALPINSNANSNDNSGISLNLLRNDRRIAWPMDQDVTWLGLKILREIGFDTAVTAADSTARDFYQRQRPRRAFVALEYEGPAWRQWIDNADQQSRLYPAPLNVQVNRIHANPTHACSR